MTTVEIEPADVIRLIEQYLKEKSLFRTLEALQEETSVNLNIVDSTEQFVNDINAGHWDVVLKTVKLLKIPEEKLIELYEQVAIELIEIRETKAATWLIHKTEPMLKLKIASPERHLFLQNLINKTFFDPREAYSNNSKERRRAALAESLKKEVSMVPPQRLLSLLCDALKWQKHEGLLPTGSSIDIFTGKTHISHVDEETYPNILHKHCIKPLVDVSGLENNDQICVFCASFTPDGLYLIVGYSTGLVEVRNSTTGRLAHDLKYQAQKNYIVTPTKAAALSLCLSASEMLAVGDKTGDISVWKIQTGQLIQVFKSIHNKGVNCLVFHRNNKEILSGGLDASTKLNGMRSNRTIRDFKGHRSFVNAVAYSKDDNYIVTGSSDCTVKIWNAKTAVILHDFQSSGKVHTVLLLPHFRSDIFLIGDRTNRINLLDLDARVRVTLIAESKSISYEEERKDEPPPSFFACCSSPKGNWIYAIDSHKIYCFNYSTKCVQSVLPMHEETDGNSAIGVFHHPFMNCLATFDIQGNLKLWKP